MTGEVIKQFLVSLGFGVDEASLKKFTASIKDAYVNVVKISAAVTGMATGAFYGISKISEGFEEFGYSTRMIAPAINKAILLRKAMVSAYKDAGINIVQAVQQSIKFNFALAKTKYQLEGIVKSTAIKFLPALTKQMDIFRSKVSANMPKILALLEKFVKFVFLAFEGVVVLGTRLWSLLSRVWDILEKLDTATGGWSTKILAVITAWKLLNLSFLATPIGMVIAGMVALLALYDDFKTWQEGGESLFNWSVWVPTINAFTDSVSAAFEVIKYTYIAVEALGNALVKLFTLDFSGFFDGLVKSGDALWGILENVIHALQAIGDFQINLSGGLVDVLSDLFGGKGSKDGKDGVSGQDGIGGKNGSRGIDSFKTAPTTSPLGSSNVNNNSSQVVKQETNITVQGSNNPEITAKNIANEQNRVNFNMARNMKGASR